MRLSPARPLLEIDLHFAERHFPTPGRLIDLGCGTGRLLLHFAAAWVCLPRRRSVRRDARGGARESQLSMGLRSDVLKANLVELDRRAGRDVRLRGLPVQHARNDPRGGQSDSISGTRPANPEAGRRLRRCTHTTPDTASAADSATAGPNRATAPCRSLAAEPS